MILANTTPVIVPIVAPISGDPSNSGRVINVPATPQVHVRWLERNGKGHWIIRSEYRDEGWSLLQSLYEQEGNSEGWAFYQRYLDRWAAGATRSRFPPDRLPEEVKRRQSCGDDPEFQDEFAVPPTMGKVQQDKPKKAKAEG